MARRLVNNGAERREERRQRAEVRQAIANQRSPEEQLTRLDRKFGKGKGAAKERAKLLSQIPEKKGNPGPKSVPGEPKKDKKKQKIAELQKRLELLGRQSKEGVDVVRELAFVKRKLKQLQEEV